MHRNKIVFFLLLIIVLSASTSEGKKRRQNETLNEVIDSSLKLYTYKVGFLRVIPEFKINVSYDNNALASASQSISDVVFETGPAFSEKFAIKRWMLFKANQHVSYAYYNKLDKLRNFPYNVDLGILTGRKTILLDGKISRNQAIIRPTSESDIPASQMLQNMALSLKFPLFMWVNTTLSFNKNMYSYQDPYLSPNYDYERALSRDEHIYMLEFQKLVTAKTQFFVQASKEFYLFKNNPLLRNHTGTQTAAGFIFGPSDFFTGYIKLGYKSLIPDSTSLSSFKGFIMNGQLEYHPFDPLKVDVGLLRQPQFSVYYSINNYYVQNQYSIGITWAYREKHAIGIGYLIGKNEYPNQFPGNQNAIVDNYNETSMKLIYKIRKDLYLEGGAIYYQRKSTFFLFADNRILFFINTRFQM